MRLGTTTRILVTPTLLISVVVALTMLFVNQVFRNSFADALHLQSASLGHRLRTQLERILAYDIEVSEIIGFEVQCEELVRTTDLLSYALVADEKGTVLFRYGVSTVGDTVRLPNPDTGGRYLDPEYETSTGSGADRLLVVSMPVVPDGERLDAWIQVGYRQQRIAEKTRPVLIRTTLIGLALMVVSGLLNYLILRRYFLGPTAVLISAIDDIERHGVDSSRKIPVISQDEFGRLTKSFNQMTEAIQDKNRQLRDYTTQLEERVDERTRDLSREIEERKRAEAIIGKSLNEKEMLLKEIHHRVKNNLQIVSSLLNLQANSVQDQAVRASFQESMSRIGAIALIHEKLYRSVDIGRVNFNEYVSDLIGDLVKTYRSADSDVRIVQHVEEVRLDIDTAIPCGLILNELVTNALKYAFGDHEGTLSVSFARINDSFVLTVHDDGPGFPDDFELGTSSTLGLRVVSGLVEGQLQGQLSMDRANGTAFRIEFPALGEV